MKKFAVILAGCGSKDGSEIHEATLLLYAIAKQSASYTIFAPNRDQFHVVDFVTNEVVAERRNMMVEAARIARGAVRPLEELRAEEFDVLAIPGGFGTAKNLFTFAQDGAENMTVSADIKAVIENFYRLGKPIGAMCIAPVMLSKIFSGKGLKITLGPETDLTKQLTKLHGSQIDTVAADQIVIDRDNKIVTVPCYMYDASIAEVGDGAAAMVEALINLSNQ